MLELLGPAGTATAIIAILILSGIKILKEYERGVIFRLGRMVSPRGPGIIYVIPLVEKMLRLDLRTLTIDIPPQDVITKDNVSVKVNAVLYFSRATSKSCKCKNLWESVIGLAIGA